MSRGATLTGNGITLDLVAGPVTFAGPDLAVYGTGPAAVSERSTALLPGARVVAARHLPRDVVVPIRIVGDTPGDVEDALAELARCIDPVAGAVTLTVARPDASVRTLTARYSTGLEQLTMAWCGAAEISGAVALRAHDPYWRSDVAPLTFDPIADGTTTTATDWDAAGAGWNDALVPFNGFGGSDLLATVDNAGDVETWPVFTVTGPATEVRWHNLTTGTVWRIDSLAAGQTLVVDTTPGVRTVSIDGRNAYGRLVAGSTLWGLSRGDNTIVVRLAGSTGATTSQMAFAPRYLTC